MTAFRDIGIVYMRELRPTLREPLALVFSLTQPLIFLFLFGPMLTSLPGMDGISPWQWFVPGILVMIALSSTGVAGYNLLLEMQTGSHERLLVTPINRSALLVGRALKEVVPLVVQSVLIIIAVIPLGFRLYPLGVVLGLVVLAALGIGLGALSYALAIAVKDKEWMFWVVQQTFLFPLLILSGMLLPLELAPRWMQIVALFNPVTYIVNAQRALFAGDVVQMATLYGAAAALGLVIIGLWLGTRAMRRATV